MVAFVKRLTRVMDVGRLAFDARQTPKNEHVHSFASDARLFQLTGDFLRVGLTGTLSGLSPLKL